MRILLTGNKGFIGAYLQAALQTQHEVVTFDCATDIATWRTTFLSLNLKDIDLVIHCGAISDSTAKGNHLWLMNYETTKDLAEWVLCRNTRLLFLSSCTATDPQHAYGWTKRVAEDIVSMTVPPRNLSIFRLFNVWAFNEPKTKPNRSILSKLITGDLAHVYRDCVRYFIHVTDVVRAVIQQTEHFTSGTYEIRGTELTMIEDLVDRVYATLTTPLPKPTLVDCPIAKEIPADEFARLPDWDAKIEVSHCIDAISDALEDHYLMRGVPEDDPEYNSMRDRRQKGLA